MSDEIFKDFGVKKEGDNKMEKEDLEIKIKLPRRALRWIERLIFIIIIAILLVMVFYNPFCDTKCEKGLSDITSEPVEDDTDEPEIEEEIEMEEEPEEEQDIEPEPEEPMSGNIVLTLGEIELDENKTRVESIMLKIDNQKEIFTPLVWVYWYDRDSTELIKSNPKGGKITYPGAIPIGVKQWKLDTELTAHYMYTEDDDKEFFKVELYDAADGTELDVKSKSIATG